MMHADAEFSSVRSVIIDAVRDLADGTGFQGPYWVSHEFPTETFFVNIKTNLSILYNDTMVLPDPAIQLGTILTSEDEVKAMRQLARALDRVIDRVREPSDMGYVHDTGWQNVIESAAVALGVFQRGQDETPKSSELEKVDHWVVPLAGERVVQCRYDYAFTLMVGQVDQPYVLRMSDRFELSRPDGSVEWFEPEAGQRQMGGTLRLLRKIITRTIARKDGRLEIDFDDGSLLRLSPSSGYEPWEIHGPNGLIIVANTDGELVVWT